MPSTTKLDVEYHPVDVEDTSARLLRSSEQHSRDPLNEVDWDAPVSDLHGLIPEASTLYGTPIWDRMTESERAKLTRLEMASIMQTGIWFEMILQEILLREQYRSRYHSREFQWSIQEIREECAHTMMFARASEKLAGQTFLPSRTVMELGRFYKNTAWGALGYVGILIAEEVLDVLQRAAMHDERVDPLVRLTSDIHVFEESRHMKFARAEIKDHMNRHPSRAYRVPASLVAASVGGMIVSSLVSPEVYSSAGLDRDEATMWARRNVNHRLWLASASRNLMDFVDRVGLAQRPSIPLYRKSGLLF